MENEKKECHCDNWLSNEKSMRNLITKKTMLEWLILVSVLGIIVLASYIKVIDNASAGTLIGATIGFCLKGIRKLTQLITFS
jgi:hypothetical protein